MRNPRRKVNLRDARRNLALVPAQRIAHREQEAGRNVEILVQYGFPLNTYFVREVGTPRPARAHRLP